MQELVKRAGSSVQASLSMASGSQGGNESAKQEQLILEALLPFKEEIQALVRPSLRDSESAVTAVASEIYGAMGWWP